MKRFFSSVGKAALYFVAFLVLQVIATLGWMLIALVLQMILGLFSGTETLIYRIEADLVALATVGSCLLTYFFFWLFFVLRRKRLSREVGFAKIPKPGIAWTGCLAAGFGMCISASFGLALIPFPASWVETYAQYSDSLVDGSGSLTVLATVLCAPLVEELVFRGLIYSRLKRGMPTFLAALLSALVFGAAHGTLLHLFFTIPMGLILCLFYEKFRSLWAPIIVHMGFNLCGMVLSYYSLDNPNIVIAFLVIGAYLTLIGFLAIGWHHRAATAQTE